MNTIHRLEYLESDEATGDFVRHLMSFEDGTVAKLVSDALNDLPEKIRRKHFIRGSFYVVEEVVNATFDEAGAEKALALILGGNFDPER